MRVTEKIQLINEIAEKMRKRYDDDDKVHFLESFNINDIEWTSDYHGYDEYINIKVTLKSVKESVLKKIADELDIFTNYEIETPPKNWEITDSVKAFISHCSEHKDKAKRLKEELRLFNIDCFVAHEDIKPSKEWQDEIDKALKTMDFFISMHTEGFSQSIWCQQEVGFAVARKVKIIPIKFEENPKGFIAKTQALLKDKKSAKKIAEDIIELLKEDQRTKDLCQEKINEATFGKEEFPF